MLAILKHELRMHFQSLTAYVFGAFLLVFVGIGAMVYNLEAAVSNFEYVLGFTAVVFIVIVPILTMRSISEERKQKTDQLLYSLPIATWKIVVGKYLALVCVFLLPLAVIAFYPLLFAQYGDVYLPTSYGSLLAFFLTGTALIAIGLFISSLTENLGFAAGMGVAAVALNFYSVSLAEYVSATAMGSAIALLAVILLLGWLIFHLTKNRIFALTAGGVLTTAVAVVYLADEAAFEGLLPNIMKQLSLFDRLDIFISGVFDLTAVVYYLSVVAFFLFLAVQSLEKRRYN